MWTTQVLNHYRDKELTVSLKDLQIGVEKHQGPYFNGLKRKWESAKRK